jgi:hypothetical protein
MSNILESITGKKKDLNPIELDAYVEDVVAKYVSSYLRNRIYLARAGKTEVKDDPGYTAVVEFIAMINNEMNYIRMWSEADMREHIWPNIVGNEHILRFIFKGTTHVSVKSFVSDEQFSKLVTHVSGALSCLSHKGNTIIDDDEFVSVLPRNDELLPLFTANQWALFLYYLTRLDIIQLIAGDANE